jgi:thiamine-phosphate pyrophosphorylase
MTLPRVYPILDTAALGRVGIGIVEAAEAFLEGGAEILQFRHKAFWSREIFAEAEKVARLCREANALFIVNDRADYAALLGAGLHLGQDDLAPTDARRVVSPGTPIGFSTHNPDQMRAAASELVDYVAFGPIFQTASKEQPDPTVGVVVLLSIRALTKRPLVAIGGITRDNAVLCWKAGADAVAIIADLLPLSCTKHTIRARMTEWGRLSTCGRLAIGLSKAD